MGCDSEYSEYSSLHEYKEPSEDEANFRQTLLERIGEIRTTGSFATGNVLDSCPIPGICVDGGKPIALPLSEEAAQNLASKSDKAPFGKGRRTLVDETVRKTLQISADRISFHNSVRNSCGPFEVVYRVADAHVSAGKRRDGGCAARRLSVSFARRLRQTFAYCRSCRGSIALPTCCLWRCCSVRRAAWIHERSLPNQRDPYCFLTDAGYVGLGPEEVQSGASVLVYNVS